MPRHEQLPSQGVESAEPPVEQGSSHGAAVAVADGLRLGQVARGRFGQPASVLGLDMETHQYTRRPRCPDVAERLRCPSCGAGNDPGQRYCGSCGAHLALVCPSCGGTSPLDFKFCGTCGTELGHP